MCFRRYSFCRLFEWKICRKVIFWNPMNCVKTICQRSQPSVRLFAVKKVTKMKYPQFCFLGTVFYMFLLGGSQNIVPSFIKWWQASFFCGTSGRGLGERFRRSSSKRCWTEIDLQYPQFFLRKYFCIWLSFSCQLQVSDCCASICDFCCCWFISA